ncbi:TPA: hypothetical protein ACJJYE_004874, partial [Enterobacter hormaechei subsp. xiangfangensis]
VILIILREIEMRYYNFYDSCLTDSASVNDLNKSTTIKIESSLKDMDSLISVDNSPKREWVVNFFKNTYGKQEVVSQTSNNVGKVATGEIDKLTKIIYSSFLNDDIQFGTDSKTQNLIERLNDEYGADFIDNVLVKILTLNIIVSTKPGLMSKFMMLISSFDAETYPLTSNIAITSLVTKKYTSVKEAVLITIENWKYNKAVRLLEDLEPFSRQYLEDYKNKIINMLKG